MLVHVVVEGFPWAAVSAVVSAIAALGTLGAVVVALRGLSQDRANRRTDASIAERKRADYLTAQAQCVQIEYIPTNEGGRSSTLVVVKNYGDRPILNVSVAPFGYSDDKSRRAPLPEKRRLLATDQEHSFDVHTIETEQVRVTWKDPEGGFWEAGADGSRLGQIRPGPDLELEA